MNTPQFSPDYNIHKIAIVTDTDGPDRMIPEWEAEIAGFQNIAIDRTDKTIEEIVDLIRSQASAALCAHRLLQRGPTHFYGAELVAALYDLKIPALLVTQYTDIDQHTSLRKWRDKTPIVMHTHVMGFETIKQELENCIAEFQGCPSEARKPYRVILNVTNIEDVGGEKMLDVYIPCWDHRQIIRFPMSLIPQHLHAQVTLDTWLYAIVNIGTEYCDELYFRNIEIAPEWDGEDERTYPECVEPVLVL